MYIYRSLISGLIFSTSCPPPGLRGAGQELCGENFATHSHPVLTMTQIEPFRWVTNFKTSLPRFYMWRKWESIQEFPDLSLNSQHTAQIEALRWVISLKTESPNFNPWRK